MFNIVFAACLVVTYEYIRFIIAGAEREKGKWVQTVEADLWTNIFHLKDLAIRNSLTIP